MKLLGHETEEEEGLGWIEWCKGWLIVVNEVLFQRIAARNLDNPLLIPPLHGVNCIVTGATSGIGLEVARQLVQAGAHVVLAVRKTTLAFELIQTMKLEMSELGSMVDVEVMELELLSLSSVVRFAEEWNAREAPLHILINNAGIFSIGEPQRFSEDGYEEHMQVNHLGSALLSMLLIPSLSRGSTSRIINVNSIMHFVGFVDTEDMNLVSGRRKYTNLDGYCSSKLAQVKFSSILQKRLPAEASVNVICVSPGAVNTNVTRNLPRNFPTVHRLQALNRSFMFSAWEGSRSTLLAATDHQLPEYCNLLKVEESPDCAFISHHCQRMEPSKEAQNPETSRKVRDKTLQLIGPPNDALEKLTRREKVQRQYGTATDRANPKCVLQKFSPLDFRNDRTLLWCIISKIYA